MIEVGYACLYIMKTNDTSSGLTHHVFHVAGMHCKSCVVTIEGALSALPYVSKAKVSLSGKSVRVEGDFGDRSAEDVALSLSEVLASHGYSVSVDERLSPARNWSDFKVAVPVAIGFAGLFVFLQKLGLVNLVDSETFTYGTSFAIGVVASVSTCMAVVGGLVLSMSATFAREGDKVRPQVLFHVGRLVAFFILGGLIGGIGSVFTLSPGIASVLGIIIGIVMLFLGINLLGVFHWTKSLQPSMPKFLARHALSVSRLNHTLTPLLVGVATFFLPCGFTQSMQIYTLTSGGFLEGGLTMLVFALGTLPALAIISFSSLSIGKGSRSGVFFKSAGLIVILFALFNLINSLVVIGVLPPIFNF